MQSYHLDVVPFEDARMDVWRENFKGVEVRHAPTGFTVSGAVDDIWVNPSGEVHVVDYKATSKDEEVTLDAEWQDGYKRQMEVYQWLLRGNGLTVSDTGYFVYANGRTDLAAFDAKLEFTIKVIPYTGNASWVEGTLLKIKECLDSDAIPKVGASCDYCTYREAAATSLQTQHAASSKQKDTKSKASRDPTNSLF